MVVIYVMSYDELASIYPTHLPTCVDKGYPEIIEEGLDYWVMITYDGCIIGYTCSKDMGDWVFVGNTYIMRQYRGNNIHRIILTYRNHHLPQKPKVTIMNPIEGTPMNQLVSAVEALGYTVVSSPDDVADIMDERMYWNIECPGTTIWRVS